MKIIIDITEEQYEIIKELVKNQNSVCPEADSAEKIILNGTPLPKGHGELIDRNKIEFLKAIYDAKYGDITWSDATKKIKYSAPTIIEADKESEEENADSN